MGKENWRWNQYSHRTPSSSSVQVIDNPTAKPRRYPVGFGPAQPEAEPPTPTPFAPQITARRRV